MARIRFNQRQLKRVLGNLEKRFDEFTQDPKELASAGEIVVREIKANSRQGKGFDGDSFPSLKPSTIENRRRYGAVNNTSRFFSPNKSNVTFLGDTIEAIKYTIKGKTIEVFGDGNHSRVKGIRVNFLKGSDASISDILKGLADRGWRILGVSERAREQITQNFRRFIRRKLR